MLSPGGGPRCEAKFKAQVAAYMQDSEAKFDVEEDVEEFADLLSGFW